MAIAIDLSPDTERLLIARASETGENAATVAARMLSQILEWEEQDRTEAAEGIKCGLADFEAGRFRPFAEFANEQRAKHSLSGGK